MNFEALVLVIVGALFHALWNFFAKKASGGVLFVWLYGLVSLIPAVPAGILAWLNNPQPLNTIMWFTVIASALLHLAYSILLQRGYREGDFSLVYPLARGTGPLLSVFCAILILGEAPSLLGWVGIVSILIGIIAIAGVTQLLQSAEPRQLKGLMWGILTGVFIAAYTVMDGWAIKGLGMLPVVFYVLGLMFRTLLLAPSALRNMQALREQWDKNRYYIIAVGILSPLAYTLVLFALTRAPLSYVAPIRELSMLIGTFIGAQLLQEQHIRSRMVGTALMLLGVIMLAFA